MRGWTALHAAAQAGNPRVVRELMQFSADVEARTTGHGATPLHVSAMNGRCEVVEILISKSPRKEGPLVVKNKSVACILLCNC